MILVDRPRFELGGFGRENAISALRKRRDTSFTIGPEINRVFPLVDKRIFSRITLIGFQFNLLLCLFLRILHSDYQGKMDYFP